jgi:hypothetical protein
VDAGADCGPRDCNGGGHGEVRLGSNCANRPSVIFPRLEFFDVVAKAPPGRILGYSCLPANLAHAVGRWDVRGYDGVDPARLVRLLDLAAAPGILRPSYAVTQWFQPRANVDLPGKLKLPPVLDLLGLLVLADRWDPGWAAYLDGRPAHILRVDHALRAVVVPAGPSAVEFRYEPASFVWGLRMAVMALVGVISLLIWERSRRAH